MTDDLDKVRCVTFYSYKGGVGRSMAVANIAVDLAERNGCRILVIDWDLDAPGLHYYFGLSDEALREQSGLVDYLENGADVLLDPGLESTCPWTSTFLRAPSGAMTGGPTSA